MRKFTPLVFLIILVVVIGLAIYILSQSPEGETPPSFEGLKEEAREEKGREEEIQEKVSPVREEASDGLKQGVISIAMKLTSPVFNHQEAMPAKYTCDGENVNPPLLIAGVPEEAKSLVLIMDDPDAPSGTWLHWTVWNIVPNQKEISENRVPEGAQEGVTSFGRSGYGGPCPPSGEHRYFFKLFALASQLELPAGASREALEKAMEGYILAQAELVGLYRRQ